tara:strand:- start:2833 stop:3873 length:1041 start_codon:yes stop_codon:yes gene_type:complete
MKLFLQIVLILVIFLKTGNLLSENSLFNVNNISFEKKENFSVKNLADEAIKEAFKELMNKILLTEDIKQVTNLNFLDIKELVKYYNIVKNPEKESNKINFSVTFDKDKIHNLFYKKTISYSDITDKEFYILPILLSENEIFVFSNNYYYENWNKNDNHELIEFILPIENIEIIQIINQSRDNLLQLELNSLFKEYLNQNIALILIDKKDTTEKKIYIKTAIHNKFISKSLTIKKNDLEKIELNEKVIFEVKKEIINLIKSQNLIDISTPSFLNVKLDLNQKNNLALLKSRIKNVDLIENIFVQEFNKESVDLKIKYLGKLDKIINQLKKENINLKLVNDYWIIKIL